MARSLSKQNNLVIIDEEEQNKQLHISKVTKKGSVFYSPRLSPFENEELKQVSVEDSASREGTHELPRFLPVLKARK